MLTMDQIHRIRELYYEQGITDMAELGRIVKCDWRTVRKYIDKEDFSPHVPVPESEAVHKSKLDSFKPLIDQWLSFDKNAPRKQRHTAKRVYTRLLKEAPGFDCSYRLVAEYVSKRKSELNLKKKNGYIPLKHFPGEAQADFGTADFYENGQLYKDGKYLVLSFPNSNAGYLQLNYGENLECLLEGLQAIFEHIGGVPTEIWFDNTATIVTKIIKGGGRSLTEKFALFAEHYRFKPVFMNPESGNEKGNVENKVGYLRRNELVPVPRFLNIDEENKRLLHECDKDMQREHYDIEKCDKYISELFEEDKNALLPLPSVRFDAALYTSVLTDKYGRFTLNSGKHEYSASPKFESSRVQLKITSHEVIVRDSNLNEITRHRRLYGDTPQRSMNWVPYLKYVARSPRSLRNSGIYDMMPLTMQSFLDNCKHEDVGKVLKLLSELTDRSGFESAVNVVNQALDYHASDTDSLKTLYNRTYSDVPLLPLLDDNASGIPHMSLIPARNDYAGIENVLLRGGAFNG